MSATVQDDHETRARRSGHRFPIEVELSYLLVNGKTIVSAGQGRTVDISSSGVLFQSAHCVRPGTQIELSIAWPARIDGIARMQLRASGRTVREPGNTIGVQILRY
jgi:hypothetical protein